MKEAPQFVMGPPPLPCEASTLLVSITLYLNSSFFLMMTLRNPFAGRRWSIPSTSGSVPGLKSLMRYSNGSLFWKTILPAFGVTSTLPGGSGVCSIMVIVLNRGNTVSFVSIAAVAMMMISSENFIVWIALRGPEKRDHPAARAAWAAAGGRLPSSRSGGFARRIEWPPYDRRGLRRSRQCRRESTDPEEPERGRTWRGRWLFREDGPPQRER